MPEKSEAAKREETILKFWEQEHIFEKSLTKKSPQGEFVFYEGPPTANGKPGIHHLEARAFKDAIPRYKTMRGYRVNRRAGWDTHGLPVELQVEKELGFKGKPDIEEYGIVAFNKKCRESVFTYIDLWTRFTKRIGYWVNETKAYFTLDSEYMEVLWYLFAQIEQDGRLYKDYKVLPWCPRCGTALSSHELAQGYSDVKDLAITIKFELIDEPGTYFLAWTTTPWTLPGNVALAIGKNITYGKYEKDGVYVIVADARASAVLEKGWKRVEDIPIVSLVGKKYRPPYNFMQNIAPESERLKFGKAFQVYQADFVTTEDGTGIVHIAVMYGQEDFELGNKVDLPKVHLVSPEGKFVPGTEFLEGQSVVDEETMISIVQNLTYRNPSSLLFGKSKYGHSYPFCWRCKTRLIYYARDSWYIRMSDLRNQLVAENKKVHWEPIYLRDGRMGEWLANAKDWAISRERYWGTPLPIWRSADSNEHLVIGSVEQLKKHIKKSGNKYFLMRHGEAEGNALGYFDSNGDADNPLTEKGRAQVQAKINELHQKGVTRIYASPLLRTRQTAELVAEGLGIPRNKIMYDERLRELNFGKFNGKDNKNAHEAFWDWKRSHHYTDSIPGGESYLDAKRRFSSFMYEIECTVLNETILIITHGIMFDSATVLLAGTGGEIADRILNEVINSAKEAEVRCIDFIPLPHNDDYELDLHRPYIDDIVLVSKKGTELRRVKEVMDVWFDSGAMPFAQAAKERGNKPLKDFLKEIEYPADFISEAIDQTRGWFYTLLAIGMLAGRGRAFKNVISLGHLLDAGGQKMSKSKGNVVDPFVEIEKWGVDTLRFWMYSVAQAGDSKNYDEKTVKEAARVLSWMENSAKFYELFKDIPEKENTVTVIDLWIQTRINETIQLVTDAMDNYRPFEATRAIAFFAEDLSQWYVRRIRDRVRDGDSAAISTLRETLLTLSLLLAPFAPFLAEEIYAKVKDKSNPTSVHLADWPVVFGKLDKKLSADMKSLRALVTIGLQMRQQEGVKLRQPLASFSITGELPTELKKLLAEELNVKKIITNTQTTKFDSSLTQELIKEGDDREMARAVAEARKETGLLPKDRAHIKIHAEGAHIVRLSTGYVRFDLIRDAL